MADYSRLLFDAFSAPGDAIQQKRDHAAKLQEIADRNAREDRRFDYQVGRDRISDQQWEQTRADNRSYRDALFGLQQRSADRQDAAAARPNIETFYEPETGREVKGIYDPQSPTGFRPVGGTKAPTATVSGGYQTRPDGTMTFIPGGPADPEVVARLAGVRGEARPSRPLPNATIKDLGEFGSSVEDMARLTDGFQDGYSGYKTSWAGDVTNSVGRNLGLGLGDQAAWWQDYQSRKNIVRNKLFGSALTHSEKPEFEAADINPGMTPEAIRTNLARQQMIARRAARKMATAYARQGYDRDAIEAALGMSLDDIGGAPSGGNSRQQAPGYQPQDIEAEMRRRGIMR